MYTSSCTTYTTYMYTCTPSCTTYTTYMYTCTPLHVQHTCTTYMYTCTPTPNTHEHNRWRSGTKPTQRRENKEECFLPLTIPASCRTPETSASLRPNVELMETLYPDINKQFQTTMQTVIGVSYRIFSWEGGRSMCATGTCMHSLGLWILDTTILRTKKPSDSAVIQ